MISASGYAVSSPTARFEPFSFTRRPVGTDDVEIQITYCGICHSDLHTARSEWGGTVYPCLPGHEIVGRVISTGSGVSKFSPGQIVGVGCMVDSCRMCASCHDELEQFCERGFTGTYNGVERVTGQNTYGGYSNRIVVDKRFVLRIDHPTGSHAAVAPLLCAGITTCSPLKRWGAGPGKRVGVVGLGGLGHVAVKIARAMGAFVVVFTTSEGKRDDALQLGAQEVVVSTDSEQMAAQSERFDLILDTIAAKHDVDPLLEALKRDGTLVLLGVPGEPHPSPDVSKLVFKRRQIAGSLIGGVAETQEMLDFCARHNIASDVEMIPIQGIDEAYERMLRSDVKYRFVIDMASLGA